MASGAPASAGEATAARGPPSKSSPGISVTALLAARVMGPVNDKYKKNSSRKIKTPVATHTTSTGRKISSSSNNNDESTSEAHLSAQKTPLARRANRISPLAASLSSKAEPLQPSDSNQHTPSSDQQCSIEAKTESKEHLKTEGDGAIVQDANSPSDDQNSARTRKPISTKWGERPTSPQQPETTTVADTREDTKEPDIQGPAQTATRTKTRPTRKPTMPLVETPTSSESLSGSVVGPWVGWVFVCVAA